MVRGAARTWLLVGLYTALEFGRPLVLSPTRAIELLVACQADGERVQGRERVDQLAELLGCSPAGQPIYVKSVPKTAPRHRCGDSRREMIDMSDTITTAFIHDLLSGIQIGAECFALLRLFKRALRPSQNGRL